MLSAGDLIDRSTQFYRVHFTTVLRLLFWNAIAGVGVAAVNTALLDRLQTGQIGALALAVLAALAAGVVSLFTMIMLVRLIAQEVGGPSAPELAWSKARDVFFPTLVASVGSFVLVLLGAFAFLVPGVIFWVWFAFAPAAAALGVGMKESFRVSRELSEKRFAAVLWRLLVPILFFSLLQLVAGLFMILIFQGTVRGIWSVELSLAAIPFWFLFLVNALSETIRVLLLPFFVFALTLLYFSLKEKDVGDAEAGLPPRGSA